MALLWGAGNKYLFSLIQMEEHEQASGAPVGSKAPIWIPDPRATMCMICTCEFTLTWRRHHCRACGKVRFYEKTLWLWVWSFFKGLFKKIIYRYFYDMCIYIYLTKIYMFIFVLLAVIEEKRMWNITHTNPVHWIGPHVAAPIPAWNNECRVASQRINQCSRYKILINTLV